MHAKIKAIAERYPLPEGWSNTESLLEKLLIGELSLDLVGIFATNTSGVQVSGSSVGTLSMSIKKGWFELLERASIIESLTQDHPIVVLDCKGKPLRLASVVDVFPSSTKPELWQYAKSNGVAASRDWASACLKAWLELVERDRLLRSWNGDFATLPIDVDEVYIPKDVISQYEVLVFDSSGREAKLSSTAPAHQMFPSHPHVYGTLLIPRSKSDRLPVLGFGAGVTAKRAKRKATEEALQRLAFLWDATIEEQNLRPAPTPSFHQEWFLVSERQKILQEWATGGFATRENKTAPSLSFEETHFADLTPHHLRGRFAVCKAMHPSAIPLVFGTPTAECGPCVTQKRPIHPIA